MINWIKNLFCKHEWEFINEIQYYEYGHDRPYKFKRVYICKKCLKKKEFEF